MPPGTQTGNPWLDMFGQLGAFGVVCFVVFWTFTKTVPRFSQSLSDAQDKFANAMKDAQEKFATILAGQEASGQKIIDAFLQSNLAARELFAKELQEERDRNSRNIDRILAAIEHQNKLLIYLIGQFQGKPLSEDQRSLLGVAARPA